MSTSADAELELFRQSVNCAAVLERMVGGWKLDLRESTRRALKYRRGEGEIIIVNHDGRGWWDATGSAKGDVFEKRTFHRQGSRAAIGGKRLFAPDLSKHQGTDFAQTSHRGRNPSNFVPNLELPPVLAVHDQTRGPLL
jgi:hypothetical protein